MIAPKGNNLLDFDPLEIARQLTSMEFDTFVNINPRECINLAWMTRNRDSEAPNVVRMIHRYVLLVPESLPSDCCENRTNIITNWVALTIMAHQSDVKRRVKLLKHMIKIAQVSNRCLSTTLTVPYSSYWS